MTRPEHGPSRVIEWSAAGSALDGVQSGDMHLVLPFADGALLAVMDGLGHGPAAALAARTAADVLEENADEPLPELLQRCHEGLRKTRGVVMSLASFRSSDSSMSWVGVGNVEGVLIRWHSTPQFRDEALATRGGVIGYKLPPVRTRVIPVSVGDTLILTTDGIRNGFAADMIMENSPQDIAKSILARHAKGSDDALVLVARYLG
jgi:negative regulator of sigma-B (phosphoserine phosphatase)